MIFRWGRSKHWVHHLGDLLPYHPWSCSAPVTEHNHRQVFINSSPDVACEALPRASVFDQLMPIYRRDSPGEAVVCRIGAAVIERKHGPDPVEAGLRQQASTVESFVPLGEIEHVEVKRAVRR